jgi:hypothetical protein
MNLYSPRTTLSRRGNPLATVSLALGVLGVAAALAVWATQLHRTGLEGDFGFPTYRALLSNFWSVMAWWRVTLVVPIAAAITGHEGLRRIYERQDGVTGGMPAAAAGQVLAYLVIVVSTGIVLVSFLIHYVASMTG